MKGKIKEYHMPDAHMLAIRRAVVDLLERTPGGQRRRNLARHLATVTHALRRRGYLVG